MKPDHGTPLNGQCTALADPDCRLALSVVLLFGFTISGVCLYGLAFGVAFRLFLAWGAP